MKELNNLLQQDESARTALEALTAAGGTVYIVGGAVRDAVLGGTPKDIDLMVTGLDGATIEAALKDRGRLDFTGKQFGVYRFRVGNHEVEIAMPRTEVSTGPMHTDFAIEADPFLSPEQDMSRRDFTGNAMAYNPVTGELIDPFDGQTDLQERRLRLVSPDSFRDDPLRIVRALTSAARQGLEPDDNLTESMKQYGSKIRHLPGERIQMELDKLLSGSNPARAIEIAFESGLMEYLAPELSSMYEFDQRNPHHDLTVDQHTLQVIRKMSQLTSDPDLRLAALFHDSGKPDSFWLDENAPEGGGGHFYKHVDDEGNEKGADHEQVGAELAEQFMRRLRYPVKRIERVTTLVRNHMFPYFNTEKGARKFLASVGNDPKMAYDLLLLREADASGKREGEMNEYDNASVEKARELLQRVLDKEEAFSTRDLALDGHDLMGLGFQGPEIGKAQKMLLEAVINDPSLNTRERLLALLQDASPREAKTAAGQPELVPSQPWWKWSYDGKELTIWRVNPKSGRPHHIEVTGMQFYKLGQGRVYIEWGAGKMLGSQHDDYVEIVVWEDRGTLELQDAAVEEVDKFLYAELGRTSDDVTYMSEGIDWTNLGREPTEAELDKHYYGIDDDDDPGWTLLEPEVYDPDEDSPEAPRSIHDLTESQWQLYEEDDDSPFAYLDSAQ